MIVSISNWSMLIFALIFAHINTRFFPKPKEFQLETPPSSVVCSIESTSSSSSCSEVDAGGSRYFEGVSLPFLDLNIQIYHLKQADNDTDDEKENVDRQRMSNLSNLCNNAQLFSSKPTPMTRGPHSHAKFSWDGDSSSQSEFQHQVTPNYYTINSNIVSLIVRGMGILGGERVFCGPLRVQFAGCSCDRRKFGRALVHARTWPQFSRDHAHRKQFGVTPPRLGAKLCQNRLSGVLHLQHSERRFRNGLSECYRKSFFRCSGSLFFGRYADVNFMALSRCRPSKVSGHRHPERLW